MKPKELCYTLFLGEVFQTDQEGCIKPYAHNDFHVFKNQHGQLIAWDYDWGCNCGCWDSDDFGDACRLYWEVDENFNKI